MTTSPASMGGPLSEAERLAEIRRGLKMAKMASANAPGTFWHTFTENAEFLLELVGVLEGQLATAREIHREGARGHDGTWCSVCPELWPCPTAKALGLDGGDPDAA